MDADERDDSFDVRCLSGRVPAVAMRVWDVTSAAGLVCAAPAWYVRQRARRRATGETSMVRGTYMATVGWRGLKKSKLGASAQRPGGFQIVSRSSALKMHRATVGRHGGVGVLAMRQWERREAQVLVVQPDVARPPAEGRGEDGFVAGPDSEGGLVRCQGARDEDRRERAWDRAQKRRVLAALHVPAGNAYLEVEFAMLLRSFVTKERKQWAAAA